MLTMLVCGVIGVVLGLVAGSGRVGKTGLATVFGMFGLALGVIVAVKIGMGFPTEKYVSETRQLHNLYDDTRLYGSFFLGTGTIEDVDYIFYNTITEYGVHPERIRKYEGDVYIVEDDDGDPRLETVCLRSISGNYWGFKISQFGCKSVFHIPVGSVDTSFVVH